MQDRHAALLLALVSVIALVASSPNAQNPTGDNRLVTGEFVIDPPTFINLGFEFSAAVDRGTPIPNVTQGFTGKAPDLGALEVGQPAPQYGPWR